MLLYYIMPTKAKIKYVNDTKYWNPNSCKCGMRLIDLPRFKSDGKPRDLYKLFIEKNR
jgi:hypothetical protein